MSIKELEKKIERLRPASLIVLARLPDGSEREMSAQECVEAGAEFVRVIRGGNVEDLDLILSAFRTAIKQGT